MKVTDIQQIPIVLHTMDSYDKYWDIWYFLFKKYVTNYGPIFFMTEEKEPSFVDEVYHIKTGTGEWGLRLLEGLAQIDSELIIYSQEDFWAKSKFHLSNELLDIFYQYEMDHLAIKEISNSSTKSKIDDNLYKLDQNSNYTHHHQFAIWNKDKLISNVLPHENPWVNEIEGTKRLNKRKHNTYILDKSWYISVCRRGALMDRGVQLLKKHNISFENFKISK